MATIAARSAATEQGQGNYGDGTSEITPLLPPTASGLPDSADASEARPAEDDNRPLPKLQITVLCFARLIEALSFFVILPFVNLMIAEIGDIDPPDVGFYSGLIESLFSLTQMALMIPWGRTADYHGRKPVLVISLLGIAVATTCFGLSRSLWQMAICRVLAGASAGTVVTVRSSISELSNKNTEARAFSLFAFAGNLGIFLGPLIGGTLSKPTENFPAVFGSVAFLREYPYFLPCFITGLMSALAAMANFMFLHETLELQGAGPKAQRPMSTLALLRSPGVLSTLLLYCHIMLLGLAYTAVAPLFWYTPVHLGGFGFTPLQISCFLGLGGISQAIWMLVAFPPMQSRLGTDGVLRLWAVCWPISLLMGIVLNALARHGNDKVFWGLAPLSLILASGCGTSFTAAQLALNAAAPSPGVLGTLNGVALSALAGIRTFAPAAFSSLFALGVGKQILKGYLIWVVLSALAFTHTIIAWWPKLRGRSEMWLKSLELRNGAQTA